jgi:hypothetical protein
VRLNKMASIETEKSRSRKPEKCACGRKITPLAKRLQNANPGIQRKCFTCLVRDQELRVVTL